MVTVTVSLTDFLAVVVLFLCLVQVGAYMYSFAETNGTVKGAVLLAVKDFMLDVLLIFYALYTVLTPHRGVSNAASAVILTGYIFYRCAQRIKNQKNYTNDGITVTSCNLQCGNKMSSASINDLTLRDPDYIVTLETTESMYATIREKMVDYMPVGRGEGERGGLIYLWAHKDMQDHVHFSGVVPVKDDLLPTMRVKVGRKNVTLMGVHLRSPAKKANLATWNESLRALETYAKGTTDSLVLAGDFNTTLSHEPMRRLNKILKSGAVLCGIRNSRTWPTNGYVFKKLLPVAVMGIDHILISGNLTAQRYTEHKVCGSDHKAICIRICP